MRELDISLQVENEEKNLLTSSYSNPQRLCIPCDLSHICWKKNKKREKMIYGKFLIHDLSKRNNDVLVKNHKMQMMEDLGQLPPFILH